MLYSPIVTPFQGIFSFIYIQNYVLQLVIKYKTIIYDSIYQIKNQPQSTVTRCFQYLCNHTNSFVQFHSRQNFTYNLNTKCHSSLYTIKFICHFLVCLHSLQITQVSSANRHATTTQQIPFIFRLEVMLG